MDQAKLVDVCGTLVAVAVTKRRKTRSERQG